MPWDVDGIQKHRLMGALGLHNRNPTNIIPGLGVPSALTVSMKDTLPVLPVGYDEDIRLIVTAAALAETRRTKPSCLGIV